MKDEHGNEIIEPTQLSTEELIAKTVSGVLDAQETKNNQPDPIQPDIDPFDFSGMNDNQNIDQYANNQYANNQPNPNDNLNANDQCNQFDPNNASNQYGQNPANNMNSINNIPQQVYDPRFDDLSAAQAESTKTTRMTGFMMELNNAIGEAPEELGKYKNSAIEEAKKSINSGQYIPANEMLSYLHGKDSIANMKNKENNPNPSIGGNTDLNPSGNENKPNLDDMSAEDMRKEFGNVMF